MTFAADQINWFDFEVKSKVDLKADGTFRYAADATTSAIVLAYAIGGAPALTWHADGAILDWDNAPEAVRAVFAGSAPFAFWNANFDTAIWNYATLGFPFLAPERVIDPMIQAGVSNLPIDLESASRVLGGSGKQPDGKKLIKLFCVEGAAPGEHPAEWQRFLSYARQDVIEMRAVYRRTRPLPREEWQQYWAFERINRRGVAVDVPYVRRAAALAAEDAVASGRRLVELTNGIVTRVTQAKRIANWMHDQLADAAMREVLTLGVSVPVPAPATAITDVSFNSVDPRGRLVAIAIEREAIRQRREAGEPRPWSAEPIFASYPKRKFCNLYREYDTGTCWVATNIVERFRDHPDLWFVILAARCCSNEPAALTELLRFLLPFDAKGYRSKVEAILASKRAVYRTKAYKPIMPPRELKGTSHPEYHTDYVLTPLWRDREAWRPRPDETLNSYSDRLERWPRIGGFLAAQVLADLKPAAFKDAADYATYARSGPGSRRGLNRILGRPIDTSWTEAAWHRALMQLLAEINPHLIAAGLAPLDAQGAQHWLCEFDKWERVREEMREDDGDDDDNDAESHEFSLTRDHVGRVLAMLEAKSANGGLDPNETKAREVATLRLYGAGAAPKKFARLAAQQVDGVLRGQYRFAGAGQTGRLTSRGAQIQNLTHDVLGEDGAEEAALVDAIADGCSYAALVAARPAEVPAARKLALLVRPALIAEPGKVFVWSDWSAIEARITPWLAASPGAEQVLDIFRARDRDPTQPDIYTLAAAAVLHKNPKTITKAERAIGKVVVLALGFGGSVGALQRMALQYRISLDAAEARRIVDAWREANPWAREFWGAHSDGESFGLWGAALTAWELPGAITTAGRLGFVYHADYLGGTLFLALPSSRVLSYPRPCWRDADVLGEDGKPTGEKRTELSFRRAHGRARLWHGTFCENAVQATAADILRETVRRIEENPALAFMPIRMTTHDEIVCEVEEARAAEAKALLRAEMLTLPDWAAGLPLQSEESVCFYYTKAKAALA